ncbi:MAG: T9SS type A sorting domain-containing protein [Ferruginibacter sp.]
MRKLYFLTLLTVICSFSSRSQYVTIPDANFKTSLMQGYPGAFNASQQMDTTYFAIVSDTVLYITSGTVNDWDGIQYFDELRALEINTDIGTFPSISIVPATLKKLTIITASTSLPTLPDWIIDLTIFSNQISTQPILPGLLERFAWYANSLTTLPTLPASLIFLDCTQGNLTTLPVLPAGLQTLICVANSQLTALPALPASLIELDCGGCSISSLPASLPPLLTTLSFSSNQVSFLPTLPTGLQKLSCGYNNLTALPAFPASLTEIDVSNNHITSIPALPAALGILITSNNPIGTLPALPNNIAFLYCNSNQLTSLPALPSSLGLFHCENNLLTSLPTLPAGLFTLYCDTNQLTSLPSLPAYLEDLHCSSNQLVSLPALPPELQSLDCSFNQLTSLPEFPASMSVLNCKSNYIRCLPYLTRTTSLSWSIYMDNRIGCMPNIPPDYTFQVTDTINPNAVYYYQSGPGENHFPVCSVTSNIHHCNAYPAMVGHVYNDNNNNNIKDANEPYRANVRIALSNGEFTVTDNNGYYEIVSDTIGVHTLTCLPPNYFASVPPAYNYDFNSYDTLIENNFALQATATVDSVSISVIPHRLTARPGFPMPYDITYENAGTTTLTPTIVFNYPNGQLIYDSSSNAAVINNATNLQLNESAMEPGDRRNFTAYFHVNAGATLGDSVQVIGVITANAATMADTVVSRITGSFDPNDKYATPVLTPQQVTDGKYISYNIRFQNTGNDTAFNVVITDTLSSFLQPSTLQMIGTSHPCKATVIGNAVSFEFLNIMLPDSNVNELKSHGYVSFKIKPQSSVPLNTNIPNAANIYFDYNLPVLTNTAITQIANLGTVPLKLLSFTVQPKTKNTANVYWSTFNEYNLQNFVIENSTDGSNYSAIASELPKEKQYNSYTKEVHVPAAKVVYYRLKITDTDGRFYYGPVVTVKMKTEPAGFSFVLNPVKDVLKISIKDAALMNTTARIINAQGSVVQKIYLKNETETVNISKLAAGVYVLETVNGSSSFIIIK